MTRNWGKSSNLLSCERDKRREIEGNLLEGSKGRGSIQGEASSLLFSSTRAPAAGRCWKSVESNTFKNAHLRALLPPMRGLRGMIEKRGEEKRGEARA